MDDWLLGRPLLLPSSVDYGEGVRVGIGIADVNVDVGVEADERVLASLRVSSLFWTWEELKGKQTLVRVVLRVSE